MFNKMIKNDSAVSPIVATLVLIVVAIIGAAAVGLLMGSFSSQVSDDVSTSDVSGAASNSIVIGGSTTLYPGDVNVAKAYMKDHPGVKITNQEGGSDAGIAGVYMGALDIGAASKSPDLQKYPTLVPVEVAGSAVVVISSDDLTLVATDVTKASLYKTYADAGTGTAIAGVETVVQRAEGSGTEEVFAKYISSDAVSSLDSATPATGVTMQSAVGNEGVLQYVQTHDACIGFVDWGYVSTTAKLGTGAKIVGITDGTVTYTAANIDAAHIKVALKGTYDATGYVKGLVKNCYLITNGQPNAVVQDFITYAQSPAGAASYQAAGMFGVTEYR